MRRTGSETSLSKFFDPNKLTSAENKVSYLTSLPVFKHPLCLSWVTEGLTLRFWAQVR